MATIEKRATDNGIAYRAKVRLRGFPRNQRLSSVSPTPRVGKEDRSSYESGPPLRAIQTPYVQRLADEYERTPRTLYASTTGARRSGRAFCRHHTDRIAKQRDKLLTEDTSRFAKAATGNKEADAKRHGRDAVAQR